ncbi:TetR/AcrR family transcriptional regulator [Vitiosangium sp. GDMCC 1.1324]|uniref:TetR/AcrR family transcriptional regulator n=1 Tax=Vitiosangium sp. (strain GDMCC 1.1324) TaxID=2138576 RepID=UPI000D393409|nr:TetR/AcrR family transcriptional regulator [Vitiosangium sp. GDMCC 1.1324]PTL75517.1 TetR/AcrR family transcriptional regulator [Vitiosangium sp. GDMCC 1.1324]
MRYPQGHKQQSRERIIEAAARLFRERGVASTGVDAVMSAVGLTAGGFYAHFKSKQVLVGEVVRKAFADSRPHLRGEEEERGRVWLQKVLRSYISRSHRDHPETGCPLTTLLTELPHVHDTVQPIVVQEVSAYADVLEEKLDGQPSPTARQRALALIALMVGAVAVSRALAGSALSDEMLSACRAVGLSFTEEDSHA